MQDSKIAPFSISFVKLTTATSPHSLLDYTAIFILRLALFYSLTALQSNTAELQESLSPLQLHPLGFRDHK